MLAADGLLRGQVLDAVSFQQPNQLARMKGQKFKLQLQLGARHPVYVDLLPRPWERLVPAQ